MKPSSHEITKSEKKSRPGQIGEPVMVRLQPDQLAILDDWRRRQPDLPSRAEALRRRAGL